MLEITRGAIWRYLLGIAVGGAWMLSANCTLAQIVQHRLLGRTGLRVLESIHL